MHCAVSKWHDAASRAWASPSCRCLTSVPSCGPWASSLEERLPCAVCPGTRVRDVCVTLGLSSQGVPPLAATRSPCFQFRLWVSRAATCCLHLWPCSVSSCSLSRTFPLRPLLPSLILSNPHTIGFYSPEAFLGAMSATPAPCLGQGHPSLHQLVMQ